MTKNKFEGSDPSDDEATNSSLELDIAARAKGLTAAEMREAVAAVEKVAGPELTKGAVRAVADEATPPKKK